MTRRTNNRANRVTRKLNIRATYDRPTYYHSANDYALPHTLGNPPKQEQIALDSCFMPVANMITHALNNLGAEGLPTFPGYGFLTGLAQNSLIRAGVEMRSEEMTRKWGELIRKGKSQSADQDEVIQRLNEDMNHFQVKKLMREAASTSGYYGGCLGFFDFGESRADLVNPLMFSDKTFPVGSLKAIRKIDPYLITPGWYNSVNPLGRDYFKPDVWYIQGVPVHESRLFYIAENELPALLKPAYNFFGLSLSQKVLDAVSHLTSCRESANRLLEKYSLTMFKTDMSQVLTGGFDNELQKRIAYFVQNRSNDGVAVVDKESEDIVVMTTSLAGVTDVVRQAMEYVAAMFNEPVTKMWGLSPAGFNTGDSDMQNHYDNIASLQETMLGDPMRKILNVLQFNAFGKIDPSIEFKFIPLDEEDINITVQNNKLNAERDAILCDAGVIGPEEARQRLIDDPNSGYNNLDPYAPLPAPPDDMEREDVTII